MARRSASRSLHPAPFPQPVTSFAGRRAELDRVLAHLDEETLFLVLGVGGIGKSELVYRAIALAREREAWREARAIHLEVRAGLDVTRALAELLAAAGAPPEPRRGQPTEAAHLTEQLATLARALDAAPHLVFIDDVHHLPAEPVAEALGYLARHVRRSRLFVASRHALRLPASAPAPVVTTLGPLDAQAAGELIGALADRLAVPRPAAEEVLRATHGSPFHIRRRLAGEDGAEDGLASSLAELEPTARRLLLAAALAPRRPSLARLGGAWPEGEGALEATARELERRFLLGVEDGRVAVHDLVREALLARAGPDELREARAACAARCLDELGASRSALGALDAISLYLAAREPQRAWETVERFHSTLAAAGHDHLLAPLLEPLREALPQHAVAIDLRIAGALVRASLVEDADRVLARIGEVSSDAERARHLVLSGAIAQRRGALGRARELFDEAAACAPDEATRFSAQLSNAVVASCRGEGARARDALDEGLAALAAPTDAQRGRRGWARALSWMFDERFEQAADEAARARDALPPEGHDDLANQLAMLETLSAVGAEDMVRARAAVQRIEESGLRRRVAALYRAIVAFADGEAGAAGAELVSAFEDLSVHGDTVNAYLAGYYGAAALAETGELGDAQALAERTAGLAHGAGLASLGARADALRAILAAEALQAQLAHRLAGEALAGAHAGARTRATAHRARARAFSLEGDVARALEELAAARAAVAGVPRAHLVLDVEEAAVELVGGRFERSVELAERAARELRVRSRDFDTAHAGLVLAAAYVARGRRTDLVLGERVLSETRELAERGALRSIRVGCAILSAAFARRAHRERAAEEVLASALRELDPERGSVYANTLIGAIDGGVAMWVAPGAVALLAHLGLNDAVEGYLVDRHGRRAATRDDVERERRRRGLLVVYRDGTIHAARGTLELKSAVGAALLGALIEARGEALAAEVLYPRVWEVTEYHPLQHRNTLYVAINRLRKSLREAFGEREVIERAPRGWRLADGIDACAAVPSRRA
ncbi:MAG: winged helix-turn-helix domain-containing protein [Sandaracinaceae bacterium]|nr:winged helix-turn-helix domain-containing protein [Sandaracinaceae bacterium]